MVKGKKKEITYIVCRFEKISSLSYIYGYPTAFAQSELFTVSLCNFGALTLKCWIDRLRALQDLKFDAIVMLHTTSHQMYYFWREVIERSGAPIVWFIGNEFRGMPAKMEFAKDLNIAMLVSQSISPQIIDRYQKHLGCKVIGMPVSCYDEKMFGPGPPIHTRPIDIGYRGARGPAWLGHWDREIIAEVIQEAAGDRFKLDLSLEMNKRLKWKAWRDFLQRSKTQLCVSSGGEIFELTDETRLKMEDYVEKNPNYTRDEILELMPPIEDRIRLRVLGSRMMEEQRLARLK